MNVSEKPDMSQCRKNFGELTMQTCFMRKQKKKPKNFKEVSWKDELTRTKAESQILIQLVTKKKFFEKLYTAVLTNLID